VRNEYILRSRCYNDFIFDEIHLAPCVGRIFWLNVNDCILMFQTDFPASGAELNIYRRDVVAIVR